MTDMIFYIPSSLTGAFIAELGGDALSDALTVTVWLLFL